MWRLLHLAPFVNSLHACLICLISGIIVVEAVFFIDQKLKIDDPGGRWRFTA
ncbi:MAG: hypothetical protein U1F57_05790 [bacterium]